MRTAAIGYTACALPGRLMAGRQTLDLVVVVRIHPRQPECPHAWYTPLWRKPLMAKRWWMLAAAVALNAIEQRFETELRKAIQASK